MSDYNAIRRAKLTVTEFAKIAGVSRVTVSLWVNGHTTPHALHADRIKSIVRAVGQAVRAKELPLPADLVIKDRVVHVRKLLSKYSPVLNARTQ